MKYFNLILFKENIILNSYPNSQFSHISMFKTTLYVLHENFILFQQTEKCPGQESVNPSRFNYIATETSRGL